MKRTLLNSGPIKSLALAVAVLAGFAFGTAGAAARPRNPSAVIDVFPGPNAIASALAGASSGDTLNIHTGIYNEHFTVSKADITFQAAGDGPVTVDGGCTSTWTINVTADGVTITGLRVIGGNFYAITFNGVDGGGVFSSSVRDTCGGAEYGINVFNSGSLKILGNRASGFGDAGIYIGAVNFGRSTFKANDSFGNNRGIIVENSASGTILVVSNNTHDNDTTGIWITNSDGVTVRANTVTNNNNSGIQLDIFSDNNTVTHNTVSGHRYDLANDGGTGNCWLDNVYTTSKGNISC